MSKQYPTPTVEERVRFILAGRAILSVVSKKTGLKLTYYISKPKSGNRVRWVSVREDRLDGQGWGYVGFIIMEPKKNTPYDGPHPFLWGGANKSAFTKGDRRVQGWDWLWRHLCNGGDISDKVDMFHTGMCGRCGRKLVEPSSLRVGLGPVCRTKV